MLLSTILQDKAVVYDPAITGLTGGGATKLDGVVTVGVANGQVRAVRESSAIHFYRLNAGTLVEDGLDVVRPDDYATSTNERVWQRLSAVHVNDVEAAVIEDPSAIWFALGNDVSGSFAPSSTPARVGLTYIHTSGRQWFSVGTSSVNDWIEIPTTAGVTNDATFQSGFRTALGAADSDLSNLAVTAKDNLEALGVLTDDNGPDNASVASAIAEDPAAARSAAVAQKQILSGSPVNAVAASAVITFGTPSNGDTITVNGTTYTKVSSSPVSNEFSSVSELAALIDADSELTATASGTSITVNAVTAGIAGNFTLVLGGSNAGTMSVSTASAVGVDGTVGDAFKDIYYGDGSLWIAIANNSVVDANWRRVAVLDADGAFPFTIELEDLTGEVIPENMIARVGSQIRQGNGLTAHGYGLGMVRRIVEIDTFDDSWQKISELAIPASFLAEGKWLTINGRIFHEHAYSGLVFEFVVRPATTPSNTPPNTPGIIAIDGNGSSGYSIAHEFFCPTRLDSGYFAFTNKGIDRKEASNGATVSSLASALSQAISNFDPVTAGVDSVVELWVFKEATGSPSSLVVDASWTVESPEP